MKVHMSETQASFEKQNVSFQDQIKELTQTALSQPLSQPEAVSETQLAATQECEEERPAGSVLSEDEDVDDEDEGQMTPPPPGA